MAAQSARDAHHMHIHIDVVRTYMLVIITIIIVIIIMAPVANLQRCPAQNVVGNTLHLINPPYRVRKIICAAAQ